MMNHRLLMIFSWLIALSVTSTASSRSWFVAPDGTGGDADRWGNAFTNLQDALEVAGEGDSIHVAGRSFGGGPLPDTFTVFNWQNATNVTLRGGYEADPALPFEDHPGPNDPVLWPTVLHRTTGNSRVLTLTGLTNCVIDGITVSNGYLTADAEVGGGVRFSNCKDVTLANSRVVNNQMNKANHYQNHHGGGIYFHASRVTVTNCVIARNVANHHTANTHATAQGGGAYIDSSSEITIMRSFLHGNTSIGIRSQHGHGGALHVAASGVLEVHETVITNNTAGANTAGFHGYGGAVANSGTTRLLNTLVVSNTSQSGHSDGVWSTGASATLRIENATIADNNTTGVRYGSGTVVVSNSIVWGHSADLVDIPLSAGGTLTNIWYSNIGDGQNAGQQGCLSVDPLFADRVTYHLQSTEGHYTNGYFSGGSWATAASNSPLIDAADPDAAYSRESSPNGGRLNMGAYGNTEVSAKTPDVPVVLPTLANPGALLVQRQSARLRGTVTDTGGQMPQVWFRYWADGSETTNEIAIGYIFDAFWRTASALTAGTTYHYRVRAVNSAGTNESAIATFKTHPAPSAIYVFTNGNQTAGTNWATAYHQLETAWAFAGPGDTIYLAGQTISQEAALGDVTVFRWENATNVTLRGGFEADPDLPDMDHPGTNNPALWPTILARVGRNARVLTLTGLTNCVIDGVTVSNGHVTANAEVGGGIRFSNCKDVTLANSRVTDNSMGKTTHYQNHHGGGMVFHSSRVTVTNCVIANNVANTIPAGNIHATAQGGGAYIDGSSEVSIIRSFLHGNTSIGIRVQHGYGGALHVAAGGVLEVRESVIANNTADADIAGYHGYGGAIANYGTTRLFNTLVVSNTSASAHSDGLWSSGVSSVMRIENATIADNNTVGVRYSSGTLSVSNSIVWGHTNDLLDFPVEGDGRIADVWYSCIGDGQNNGRQGCVAVDPRFADRVTYHLQSREGHYTNAYFEGGTWTNAAADSQLIDAGDPDAPYGREPDPNGGRLNMGAYGNTEVAAKTLPVVVSLPSVNNPGASIWGRVFATLRGEITDTGGQTPLVGFRYWKEGSETTNAVTVGTSFASFSQFIEALDAGSTYHYVAVASNSAGAVASDTSTFVTHPVGSVLYVSTNGLHTAGTNWLTAYNSLLTAWQIAGPGDTIYVAGQTLARESPTDDITAYRWEYATNITLRGGYQADPGLPPGDHPGPQDPAQWPTVLQRIGRNARVLTLTGLTNCIIDGITISNGYLTDQNAAGGGGILFSSCQDVTLENSRIINNRINKPSHYGTHRGGGLHLAASQVFVRDSLIANNDANHVTANTHAVGEGGGLYVNGGSQALVERCEFSGNTANGQYSRHGYGGALFVAAGGVLDLRATVLDGNSAIASTAGFHGIGGAVANNGILRMRNVLVVSNQSNSAHSDGIWSGGASAAVTLENLTIVDNNAVGLRRDGGTVSATNTIAWGHTTSNAYGEIAFGHSCVGGGEDGVNGNIDADPLFEEIDGIPYRIPRQSPCAEAGINLSWITRETQDLAGDQRWKGKYVDMGAYEAEYRPGATLFLMR